MSESVPPPAAPVPAEPPAPPRAVPDPVPRARFWPHLVPLAALALAIFLGVRAYGQRGERIIVRFRDGAGIAVGDPVSYRGVRIGDVQHVALSPTLGTVDVTLRLNPDAAGVAVTGSRFWVVRPEVSLTRVSGLDTLLGPRYVAVDPGPLSGARLKEFDGADRAPSGGAADGSLSLMLHSARMGSVREGSAVVYREMAVGSVVSVELAPDARRIEIAIRIEARFAHLVRENTRFWNVSGLGLEAGLIGGLKVKAESLETLFGGGIAMATPDKPGARVPDGRVFEMEPREDSDWLKWSPDLSK